MADLIKNAMTWLEAQRREHLTIPIIYRREESTVALPATVGKTVFKVVDDYGRYQHIESRDYLIHAADLIMNGHVILPQSGDEIEENGFVYEVMAPNGEPEWRYSDSYRQCCRIHTKLTGKTE